MSTSEEGLEPQALTTENRVLLYAGEGAFDEKTKASKWRVACVSAPLDPITGRLAERAPITPEEEAEFGSELRFELRDKDFYPLDAFNPDESCQRRAVNQVMK